MKTPVWIYGSAGKMGVAIREVLATSPFFSFAGGSSSQQPLSLNQLPPNHLLLDFSSATGNQTLLQLIQNTKNCPALTLLVGSTGLSSTQLTAWSQLGKQHRILIAPNCSLGILVLSRLIRQVKPLLDLGFDLHMQETHHRLKKDAPSGTAKYLAEQVKGKEEPSILSVRAGGVFGEHTVQVIGDHEELTLQHRAFSRQLFAAGALQLGNWLLQQKTSCYTLDDVEIEDLHPLQKETNK